MQRNLAAIVYESPQLSNCPTAQKAGPQILSMRWEVTKGRPRGPALNLHGSENHEQDDQNNQHKQESVSTTAFKPSI